MEAAFTGFQALPAPSWRSDLDISETATLDDAEKAYRQQSRRAHPDVGGSDESMARLNAAIHKARKCL